MIENLKEENIKSRENFENIRKLSTYLKNIWNSYLCFNVYFRYNDSYRIRIDSNANINQKCTIIFFLVECFLRVKKI